MYILLLLCNHSFLCQCLDYCLEGALIGIVVLIYNTTLNGECLFERGHLLEGHRYYCSEIMYNANLNSSGCHCSYGLLFCYCVTNTLVFISIIIVIMPLQLPLL